jgi:tripartite-type tricarboxylate transporter receptor subunit TctC
VIALPDVQTTLSDTLGMEIIALGPEATQKWIQDAIARWGKVVKDNNIRAE